MGSIVRCTRVLTGILQVNCLRYYSSAVGKGSFPLDLPQDFQFTPHSITYYNGHPTIPDSTSRSIPIQNPATQEILQYIDCAAPETICSSVREGHRIFTSGIWSRADPTHRFRILSKIAELLRQHAKELACRIHSSGSINNS